MLRWVASAVTGPTFGTTPALSALRSSDEGNLLALHPTVKPVAMVADAIMDVHRARRRRARSVLWKRYEHDRRSGTGRRCYGIEIDPLYCGVIVRRWQAFTRDRAVRAVGWSSVE